MLSLTNLLVAPVHSCLKQIANIQLQVSTHRHYLCLQNSLRCNHLSSCLSELKIHLQSSFEAEDLNSDKQPADPDSPIASALDQLVAPADTQPAGLVNGNGSTAYLTSSTDVFIIGTSPISEKLRDMRKETTRYSAEFIILWSTSMMIIFFHLLSTYNS